MNYRHAYHAGNFADVAKHAILTLIIEHLKKKAKPFRVIDTHAGLGLYDLSRSEATRSPEWREGIARVRQSLAASEFPFEAAGLIAPYMAAIDGFNANNELVCYPGSPCLARALMRPDDRLVANELHLDDYANLSDQFARDRQTSVMNHDAWAVLKALLPPKERRGVILVDPPFEDPGEFDRLVDGLMTATRRFANGIYMLWYPMKDQHATFTFTSKIAATGLPKLLQAALTIRPPGPGQHRSGALYGSGLIIHNPPFGLDSALRILLPPLAQIMSQDGRGDAEVIWLRGET